ncbi:MAG: SRPBCC family protein [Chloroflexaceae bacterium]|jgi:hypothetical protein|nr:SRPBCC family protein [Chloroflexaceae bacterium]
MPIYEIAARTTTRATPEQVWAVLDDFSGWPDWMPAMQNLRVELLGKELRPGYRFRLRGRFAYAELEVTDLSAMERATRFRLNFPPLTGANRCQMTPLEDGGYLLERIDQLDLFGPFIALIDATQRERFQELADEFLLSLKRTVEARGNHANP